MTDRETKDFVVAFRLEPDHIKRLEGLLDDFDDGSVHSVARRLVLKIIAPEEDPYGIRDPHEAETEHSPADQSNPNTESPAIQL